MSEYPEIVEGALDDIEFNTDGTLKRFVRLPGLDVADNHKWACPFIVNAYGEGRFAAPAVMTLWETHAREDFGLVMGIPPGLPEQGDKASIDAHFRFAAERLYCTNHITPLPFLGLTDTIIVVTHQGCMDYFNLSKDGIGDTVWRGDYKYGSISDHNLRIIGQMARQAGNRKMDTENGGLYMSDAFPHGDSPGTIPVYFTEFYEYPNVLELCMGIRKRPVVYNMDVDFFFPPDRSGLYNSEAVLHYFGIVHNQAAAIAGPSYSVACTSTENQSHGVIMDEAIPVVGKLQEILSR